MSDYTTYAQGVADAKNDLAEGWVDERMTFEQVSNQLEVMVGASKEYINGYLTVVGS